jgi:type IV pilus assembly protein PilB
MPPPIDTLADFFGWTDAGLGRRRVVATPGAPPVELRLMDDLLEVENPTTGRGIFVERALALEAERGPEEIGRVLERLGVLAPEEVRAATESADPSAPAVVGDDSSGVVGAAKALGLFAKSLYLSVSGRRAEGAPPEDLAARPLRELVDKDQLREALSLERREGIAVGEAVHDLALRAQKDLVLAQAGDAAAIDLDSVAPAPEAIALVPASLASSSLAVPVRLEGDALLVAVADPLDFALIDELARTTGRVVRTVGTDRNALFRALERCYAEKDLEESAPGAGPSESELREIEREEMEALGRAGASRIGKGDGKLGAADSKDGAPGAEKPGAEAAEDEEEPALEEDSAADEDERLPEEPPGGIPGDLPGERTLNLIFLQAAEERAEQVLVEPLDDAYRVRYRREGRLRDAGRLPRRLGEAVVERAMELAELDATRRGRPQTGVMPLAIAGDSLEVDVATLPAALGTSLALDIRDARFRLLSLDALALVPGDAQQLRALLALPPGLTVVAAPPGEGKSTLLYAYMREMDRSRESLLSLERSARARVEGAVQVAADDHGATAAAATRLRPDRVIFDDLLAGKGPLARRDEVRLALDFALTGARVIAAVEAPDAVSAIARLAATGVEARALLAPLRAVVAERLVKRICPRCREELEADDELAQALSLGDTPGARRLSIGIGCWECGGTGYRGRSGVFEIYVADDALRDALATLEAPRVRAKAAERGARSLPEKALLALRSGLTSVGQVERLLK